MNVKQYKIVSEWTFNRHRTEVNKGLIGHTYYLYEYCWNVANVYRLAEKLLS